MFVYVTTANASPGNSLLEGLRLFSLYGLSLSLFMAPAGVSAGLLLIWVWFLVLLLSRPQPPLPRHGLVWLMLAFALYALLQPLLLRVASADLASGWEAAFSWSQLVVVVPIAYALRGEERLVLRLLLLALIGLVLGTLWRLDGALLLGDTEAFFDSRPGFGFPALAYALYAGTALIGLLVLRRRCWYRTDGRRRWWALALWLVALAMLAEAVVLTQSRGSWLGLILVALLGVGLWLRGPWRYDGRIPRLQLLVVAAAILLLIGLNASKIGERLNEEQAVAEQLLRGETPADQITSLTLRWHAQRFGLALWRERPWLGWGSGTSYSLMVASVAARAVENEMDALSTGALAEAERMEAIRGGMQTVVDERLAAAAEGIWHPDDGVLKHLHNSYLELLAQLGLVGFGLWMLIAMLMVWTLYDGVRSGRLSRDLGLFLILSLSYLAVWSLFNFRMVHQDFRGYWGLLAGAVLSIALYRRGELAVDTAPSGSQAEAPRKAVDGSSSEVQTPPKAVGRSRSGAEAPRILLVRLSAIGDIVFASPLIASARRAYPRAHLAWLVQPECAPLLAQHPDLDEVIEWPMPRWRRLWRQRRLFRLMGEVGVAVKALRARRFDLAIDLQGLLKSALPVFWSGARERIGLGSREGGQWLMTRALGRGNDGARVSSEYRHLASSLGWPTDDFRLRVYPGSAAEAEAEALIAQSGLSAGYAVICPFTTRAQKHWFDARWSRLARQIQTRFGLPTLMLGGPADLEAAQSILAGAGRPAEAETSAENKAAQGADPVAEKGVETGHKTAVESGVATSLRTAPNDRRAGVGPAGSASANNPRPLLSLVGKTSLLAAAALIRRARLLVGVDTGLSHMGIAFDRPTLLLFGSTCPYTETGSATARVLYHPLPCSPCRRRPTCDGAFTCMREIQVDEVMAALAELLDLADLPADQA
ncbi:hypothetical protein CKO42_06710 [Lamprobacter modestohalophilus]|uniref:O-antigen ligase-related domain-containing protein n=1 Tax=Lamprobacter modestohalophilus TaxID=1064514 RepID=A0A9X0W7C0_9GAMM|nr:hypothetical protein [Lamprobacter modestohalophilus]